MPTSGERRALIFLASLAALGVAVRGCRDDTRERAPVIARGGAELARQIEAVDSAIATGGAKRARRAGRRTPDSAASARPRRTTDTRRSPMSRTDSAPPRDPRDGYRLRVTREDSARWSANARVAAAESRAMAARAQRERAWQAAVQAFVASPRGVDADPPLSRGRRAAARSARPPVDLDVAAAAEIERLPYVGERLARRIVADREARGPFGSIEGLRRVPGIGASLAGRLAPHVTFSLRPRQDSAVETHVFRIRRRPRGDARP